VHKLLAASVWRQCTRGGSENVTRRFASCDDAVAWPKPPDSDSCEKKPRRSGAKLRSNVRLLPGAISFDRRPGRC
jgi:hypothetical protein